MSTVFMYFTSSINNRHIYIYWYIRADTINNAQDQYFNIHDMAYDGLESRIFFPIRGWHPLFYYTTLNEWLLERMWYRRRGWEKEKKLNRNNDNETAAYVTYNYSMCKYTGGFSWRTNERRLCCDQHRESNGILPVLVNSIMEKYCDTHTLLAHSQLLFYIVMGLK